MLEQHTAWPITDDEWEAFAGASPWRNKNGVTVCIDGKVDHYDVGVLINQEYILEATSPEKEILLKSNIKKYGKGNVCFLPIKKI